MREVTLRSPGWPGATVSVAATFTDRLLGIRAASAHGVLLRTRSVHTLGLGRAISLIATDERGIVIEARELRPNRIAVFPGASIVIELPAASTLPAVGSMVTFQ